MRKEHVRLTGEPGDYTGCSLTFLSVSPVASLTQSALGNRKEHVHIIERQQL